MTPYLPGNARELETGPMELITLIIMLGWALRLWSLANEVVYAVLFRLKRFMTSSIGLLHDRLSALVVDLLVMLPLYFMHEYAALKDSTCSRRGRWHTSVRRPQSQYFLMDTASQGLCSLPGRPDIYGVGVRAAFYTQWLGTLIMEYISEDDLSDLRFISLFSSAAASISLVIGVAYSVLNPLDIYFLLLFGIGFFLFLMPLCIWRVVTRCEPHLDPFSLTNEVHGTFYYVVALTILMATLSIGTWYYTVFLPHLGRGCRDVVFMLGKVNLESKGYIIAGAVFYIGVLSSIGGFIFLNTCCTPVTHQSTRSRRNRARIIWRLRKLRLLSGFIIFTLLVVAIELPIQWNHVQGVYDFATITQLLPFLFSIGIFLHSWARYASSTNTSEEDVETRRSSTTSSSSSNGEMVDVVRLYQVRSPRLYYRYGYNPYAYNQYQDRNPYSYNNVYYNNHANWSQESQEPQWPRGVYYTRWS